MDTDNTVVTVWGSAVGGGGGHGGINGDRKKFKNIYKP